MGKKQPDSLRPFTVVQKHEYPGKKLALFFFPLTLSPQLCTIKTADEPSDGEGRREKEREREKEWGLGPAEAVSGLVWG